MPQHKCLQQKMACSEMQFTSHEREVFGTNTAKVLRKNNLVPATIYTTDGTVLHISIADKELQKAVGNYKFLNTCFGVKSKNKDFKVTVKSVDFHPITDKPIHVEFKEVAKDGTVRVLVPIVVENRAKSIGMKAGGKLNIPSHSILVECKAESIPDVITIDVSNFGIGRVVFARHIKTDGLYSFPKDVFVLSILGRGRKDKSEDAESSEESSEK